MKTKIISIASIDSPSGTKILHRLESTPSGKLQHRLICKGCPVEHVMDATTPTEDSVLVIDWMAAHEC